MAAAALQYAPTGAPSADAVMARAASENFPVAARLLAPRHRRALLAVYGFARLADELGDDFDGDRLAALDWLADELDRAYAGRARTPLLVSLQSVLVECELPREPFARLIEANRVDQRVSRYESWEQLRAYCELSANPVGELVLAIFGLRTPERVRLSNDVCTGLQLAEHLQDVAEDLRNGRIYLPQEDLVRFGCSQDWMEGVRVGANGLTSRDPLMLAPLREAIAFELARARRLLSAGAPLVASIQAWRPKLAIAAFAGGGLAALEQIERAGYEVLGGVPAATPRRRLRCGARVLRRSWSVTS
ncbi:MAG: squalene synthase HpnC [Solirubrobacteraceae bacterium]